MSELSIYLSVIKPCWAGHLIRETDSCCINSSATDAIRHSLHRMPVCRLFNAIRLEPFITLSNTLFTINMLAFDNVSVVLNIDFSTFPFCFLRPTLFVVSRSYTATPYDRLLNQHVVRLSVCNAVHCSFQGRCTGLKVVPACS